MVGTFVGVRANSVAEAEGMPGGGIQTVSLSSRFFPIIDRSVDLLTVVADGLWVRSITAGAGVTVSGTTDPTIGFTGVLSVVAGAGIGLSGEGQSPVVSNTGVLSVVAGANISVSTTSGVATVTGVIPPLVYGAPTLVTGGGSSADGIATSVSRSDHVHGTSDIATLGANTFGGNQRAPKVGVGMAPVRELDVAGVARFTAEAGNYLDYYKVGPMHALSMISANAGSVLGLTSSTHNAIISMSSVGEQTSINRTPTEVFDVVSGGESRLMILNNGDVGIGVIPTSKLTVNGALRLSGSVSGYVGLVAPENVSGNTTYTLPSSAGSAGSSLRLNGSTLYWDLDVFTSFGTNLRAGGYALYSATTGSNNVAIGFETLMNVSTGSNNVAIGFETRVFGDTSNSIGVGAFAGTYETASNSVYIDSLDRTDLAGGRANSLIYGVTNATSSSQTLALNAVVSVKHDLYGNGSLRLRDADASHYIGLKSPATVSTSIDYTLPAVDGTTGQVLQTNGAGLLSWGSVNAGVATNVANDWTATQTFSNATYPALFTGGNVGIGTATPVSRLTLGGETANFPVALTILPTGAVTSRRATLAIDNWLLMQDVNGSGTKDFSIYQASPSAHRLFIAASGNVGIGTSGPSVPLDVVGAARFTGRISGAPTAIHDEGYNGTFISTKPATGLGSGQHINLIRQGNNVWSIGYYYGTGVFQISPGTATDSSFTSAYFCINTNGYVGIGTSSPGYRHHVNGSSYANNVYSAGSAYLNGVTVWSGGWSISTNVAIGQYSNANGTMGSGYNVAIGYYSGRYLTGGNNFFGGAYSGYLNSSGNNNVGIGSYASYSTSTGGNNVAIGYTALYSNTTGSNNVAIGFETMRQETGSNSTAVGAYALRNTTTAGGLTAIGYTALYSNTTGDRNVAVGIEALYATSTGVINTAVGAYALRNNTTASALTAVGGYALHANTTGANNTAVGEDSLKSNTSGGSNTAVGIGALQANTTSGGSTAVGAFALYFSTGGSNTAVGDGALYTNTTGIYNTAVGSGAIRTGSTGSYNSSVGLNSLYAATTGSYNNAMGVDALRNMTTGNRNVAIGQGALLNYLTGSNSVALGWYSGAYETASNSVYIDSLDRTDLAGGRANSLIYGVTNATSSSQTLALNAVVSVKHDLRLLGSASGYVGLTAASAAGATTYTLPSSDGTNGQSLTTNGAGVLSWASGGGGGAQLGVANDWTATQTFSNATYPALFTGGNVGIGTATPESGLHVSGRHILLDRNYSLRAKAGDGVGATQVPLMKLDSSNNITMGSTATAVGTYFMTGGEFSFINFGGERMRVLSSGEVGIGTSTPHSTLHNAGATAFLATSITGATTLGAHTHVFAGGSTAYTVTLPTAVGIAGRTYWIKRTGTGTITIDGNGAETIDGAATLTIGTQYNSYTLVSDGANWFIV